MCTGYVTVVSMSYRNAKLEDTSAAATSQARLSAILLLISAENYKIRGRSGLQWHNVQIKSTGLGDEVGRHTDNMVIWSPKSAVPLKVETYVKSGKR
jgi:mRNA-degrading endonuclease toxin of MazEF toxin-antitoxin module